MRLKNAAIQVSSFRAAIVVGCIALCPSPARADATVFVGRMTSGGVAQVAGGSAGRFITPNFGFELELAQGRGGDARSRHRIGIFTGNFLIQSASRPRHPQIYASLGFGIYGETTADGRGSGEIGFGSLGAGVKVKLAGPLRVRLEYRVFRLGDPADASPDLVIHRNPQRVSLGFGIAF